MLRSVTDTVIMTCDFPQQQQPRLEQRYSEAAGDHTSTVYVVNTEKVSKMTEINSVLVTQLIHITDSLSSWTTAICNPVVEYESTL